MLDPTHPRVLSSREEVVEAIITAVAKDIATDTIHRVEALHKKACGCVQKTIEKITTFVECLIANAQAYIHLKNKERESAEN